QRHDELHPDRDGQWLDLRRGTRGGSADRVRRGRSLRRCQWPGRGRDGDDLEYARELDLGLKLVGTAERCDGGLSVHVYPTFLYSGHPLASISGPFNAVTVESETITELTMSGPGAGGRQTASAVLGDVVSVMTGGARPPAPPLALAMIEDIENAFYLHLDVADQPGVL